MQNVFTQVIFKDFECIFELRLTFWDTAGCVCECHAPLQVYKTLPVLVIVGNIKDELAKLAESDDEDVETVAKLEQAHVTRLNAEKDDNKQLKK